MLIRLFKDRRGTAEIVGSVMFLVILLFAFTNVYLWHDRATREMNNALLEKMNSPVSMKAVEGGLNVTNNGGVDVALSRLWIITETQHMYADLENIAGRELWVDAGSTLQLNLNPTAPPPSGSPVMVTWDSIIQRAVVQYAPAGTVTFKILTTNGNTASCTYPADNSYPPNSPRDISRVLGDFIPDYHSVQWARCLNGKIDGRWNTGWIIPDSPNFDLFWRINLTYYGKVSIGIDQNSMLFFYVSKGGMNPPFTCLIVDYDTITGNIRPYAGREVTVLPSSGGSNVTLYFDKMSNNEPAIKYGSMMSLTIYGMSPSTYAQSFPLFAVGTRTPPSITITSSPAGSGFVKVDGNAITTPATIFNWTAGSTHTLQALSPVAGGTGIQYVWTGWSDGGSQTHTYTVPSSSATVTANYKIQHYLTVNNGGYGTASGQGWYDSGSSASFSISPTTVSGGTGTQYVFSGWTGSGSGSYTGASSSSSVTMNNAITEMANWKTQWRVTFQQSGLSSDATGTILTVGTNTYTYGQLPQTGMWVDDGTTYSYNSVVPAGTGKRYVSTGVTGGLASPIHSSGTVTGNYKTQYLLTVKTQGLSGAKAQVYINGVATTDDYGVSSINDASTDGWRKWFDASPSSTGTIGVDNKVSSRNFNRWVEDGSIINPHAALTLTASQTLTAYYA